MNKFFRIYFSPESNQGNPAPDPIKPANIVSVNETEAEKSKKIIKPNKKK